MTKEREYFIDRMIRIYGFENPIVIEFAILCEKWDSSKWNDKVLETLVKAHEETPCFD